MKKRISILLSFICVIALVGCSSNPPAIYPTSTPPISTTAPSSTPIESGTQGELPKQDASAPSSIPSSNPSEMGSQEKTPPTELNTQIEGETIPTVNIQIGDKNFEVTLYDNDSTRALLEKLPLSLNMNDQNGNEKYYFFPENFPTNSGRVENIKTGDLVLYGSDCLVLFYESFSTSYSYTKLGYVEDTTGLADALGGGSAVVAFYLN